MTLLEILSIGFIDVYCVAADVPVVGVARVPIVVVVIVPVIVVVVAVTVVIAAVVVAAVPGGISVVGPAVIHHRGAVPPTVPTAVAPAAASTAHHSADSDASAETDNACRSYIASGVRGSHIGRYHIRRPVNHGRVVLRNVDNLWVGGLNHNSLRGLLHHGDLRIGLETTFCFGLRA